MKKRFLCILVATALLLGILAGCGNGSTGASDSDKPGVGSTESDKGGHADDDPVAVMEARVKAVNDAINYTCVGLEETVESGLLFYSLAYSSAGAGSSHDYNPDKPLDYYAWYEMYIRHAEGIVSEDTYVALLKNEQYTREVASSDVIETDDLYVYYSPSVSAGYCPWCYILVKDTDIIYLFTVGEEWYKADYYGNGYYDVGNSDSGSAHEENAIDLSYTGGDTEYIFTDEFWKAFAQTAKFVGKADDSFTDDELINGAISTIGHRGEGVEVPYIEEWYAEPLKPDAPADDPDAIYHGFEAFLANSDEEYGFLVIDDFGQGEPTMFFNNGLYKCAGGGEVALIHDFAEDVDESQWTDIYTDADRARLLFCGGGFCYESLMIDLKTFDVTDEVYIFYDMDSEGIREFSYATVNGVSVDEETAWGARDDLYLDIYLGGKETNYNVDLGEAWKVYNDRD